MRRGKEKGGKPYAMWTNYWTLVNSFSLMFNLLWEETNAKAVKMAKAPKAA